MAINWRLRSTVFRLLAAVYAEFGDEAVSISQSQKNVCADFPSSSEVGIRLWPCILVPKRRMMLSNPSLLKRSPRLHGN
jgi:hypothetical protein